MTFLLLLFSFFLSTDYPGQPVKRWFVELNSSEAACVDTWWRQQGMSQRGFSKKTLVVEPWLVIEATEKDMNTIRQLPCVISIKEDQKIEWRDLNPNDPAYINQFDMELIDMREAWDIATGGVTAEGDTIVVALIDFGFQPDHVDLFQNIWKNKTEIPNDNIDNDNNSYTDDYLGVNITTGNDVHAPASHHGTSVAGIVGAKGNNGIGVAGVNWDVKLMLISGADFESQLIEAYEYIYDMRRRYRLTNGQEGAFIVVTNLSGGINNQFAVDHPLWCNMYDKLGEEGILSVTAAPNQSVSVDMVGDMPTTCTSPFMITVTNVDLTDVLLENAGYGPVSIDIGAPGHGTLTTGGNNQYREFPGTSAAAPHVTGSVALIYNAACLSLLQELKIDPEGTALSIKDIILESGADNNSLEGMTVTGKRLQVDEALRRTEEICGNIIGTGVKILSIRPNPPAEGFIQALFEVKGDTSTAFFQLIDTKGSLIREFGISGAEFSQGFIDIKTEPLASGIYLLSLRNGDEKAVAKFFVR